jgi:rod shape determining protein RodA
VFGGVIGGLAMFAPIAWFFMLRPYQKDRILTFRDPENDPLGAGWNIIQSKIAIGSGGSMARAGARAAVAPELHSRADHRLRVLGAERGIRLDRRGHRAGAVPVRDGALPVDRGHARDTYSRLLAGATGLSFFVYVLVNGGMISGLLPVVGVPMPLISYGGTSAVSLLAGLGVAMAVKGYRPVNAAY